MNDAADHWMVVDPRHPAAEAALAAQTASHPATKQGEFGYGAAGPMSDISQSEPFELERPRCEIDSQADDRATALKRLERANSGSGSSPLDRVFRPRRFTPVDFYSVSLSKF